MSTASLTIVIPCYNEEQRLKPDSFISFLDSYRGGARIRFIFVNDGSRDRTENLLQDLVSRRPKGMVLLTLTQNSGKAAAVRAGLVEAMKKGPSDGSEHYVGYWDADLATPLDAIPSFVEILDSRQEIALVMGARVKLLGREIERLAVRHYLGRGSATLISLALGIPVYDTQCGAKLFRDSDEFQAIVGAPFISRFLFDVELIARMIEFRLNRDLPPVTSGIYELPLFAWRDVKGSKVAPYDYGRGLRDLWSIYRRYARSTHGSQRRTDSSLAKPKHQEFR